MSKKDYKIGVFGLWHLGCVICGAWTKLGFEVTGFDYNKKRISDLNNGKTPIYEPDLDNILIDGIKKNSLKFSNELSSLRDCNYIFLSYDTHVKEDDCSDVSILNKSVKDLITIMKDHSVLIISSQSPIGL